MLMPLEKKWERILDYESKEITPVAEDKRKTLAEILERTEARFYKGEYLIKSHPILQTLIPEPRRRQKEVSLKEVMKVFPHYEGPKEILCYEFIGIHPEKINGRLKYFFPVDYEDSLKYTFEPEEIENYGYPSHYFEW